MSEGASGRRSAGGPRAWALAALGHLALAALALLPRSPLGRMVGHPDGDVWNHAWGAFWFWERLTAGALPWRTELLYGPGGGTLWYIDPIGAAVGAPWIPLLGIEGAWNLTMLAHLAVASAGAAALARQLSGPGPHRWIASVALLFGPYLLSEVHNGISEACDVGPALFALAATARAHREGELQGWLVVGLCLGWAALGSAYYALSAGLVIAIWSLPLLLRRPGQIPGALLGAVTAVTIAAPIGALMRRSVDAGDALVHRASEQIDGLMLHNAVDPRTFFWPFGFQSVDLAAQGEPFLHSGYLGFAALGLAAVGLRRTRAWGLAAAALAALVIALGPWLFWDGAWLMLESGARLAMPYQALELLLPPQAITHSLRLGFAGIAAIAALAAAGAAGREAPIALGLAALVGIEMVTLGGAPWPPAQTAPLSVSASEQIAAEAPGERGSLVLDLPGAVGDTMATSRYLALQATHGRPIPYRPDARLSTSSLNTCRSILPFVYASERRPEHMRMLRGAMQSVTSIRAEEFAACGVDWIAVHRDLERGGQNVELTEALLQRVLGDPVISGPVALYRVAGDGSIRLTDEEKAALGE